MKLINQLSLSKNLSAKTAEFCFGIENGSAQILQQVSQTTADLLQHWFGADSCLSRNFNFHQGQKQAILNVIFAHEVLKIKSLKDLYLQIAPEALLESEQSLKLIDGEKNNYPKYCLKMATGTGKTWVLQSLMIWQLLNANRDKENQLFTKNFLVVAPGLIVYERLLDAFAGKEKDGKRDFSQSDIKKFCDLFIPPKYREEVFAFFASSVCEKNEIGKKITGGGIVAVANWQTIKEQEEEIEEDEEIVAIGADKNFSKIAKSFLPLSPGTSQGNDLNQLNRNFERGNILNFLANLKSLMVFNDEAHHIHEFKKDGETSEVEWQNSLNFIAKSKIQKDAPSFAQIDFSATPYNQVGAGENPKLNYFAHIVCDFELKTAMKLGLVKALTLMKRREFAAQANEDLEFRALRDENGKLLGISEGQRIMLRAGLAKLAKLENDFAKIDETKHPKMLVICEDTAVNGLVEKFFLEEGIAADEILRVDSNKKGEINREEWAVLKEKLFNIDAHQKPRVIISVLMLREGFDVNNVCVIVPLRSSASKILLEQTIGRGLRLMWRGSDFEQSKKENRKLISEGKNPENFLDVLTIVEHPKFEKFYEDLIKEGLVGEISEESDNSNAAGDLIAVELCEDFEKYDFAIPFVFSSKEENILPPKLDYKNLEALEGFSLEQLKKMIGKGEKFVLQDVQTGVRFGDYRIDGGVMTAKNYNDFIARMTDRIIKAFGAPLIESSKIFKEKTKYPNNQINQVEIASLVDLFIRHQLFAQNFDPFFDENWRVLLIDIVANHIIKVVAKELFAKQQTQTIGESQANYRRLSEVEKILVRQKYSLETFKCIYGRLGFSSNSGGLEKAFIEALNLDSQVLAFCKIHEQKHDFLRLAYIKEEGFRGFYCPDFLVKINDEIFLVETKADAQISHPNVQRKRLAAFNWCENNNKFEQDLNSKQRWKYCLLGESYFYENHKKSASIFEILNSSAVAKNDHMKQRQLQF